MNNKFIFKIYLKALLETVDKKSQENLLIHLQSLFCFIMENKLLLELLSSPIVNIKAKINLIKILVSESNAHQIISPFIQLLIKKKRFDLINCFQKSIEEELLKIKNETSAIIYTANNLPQSSQNLITDQLKNYTGQNIKADFYPSAEILGGFKAYLQNKIFDATINNSFTLFTEKIK